MFEKRNESTYVKGQTAIRVLKLPDKTRTLILENYRKFGIERGEEPWKRVSVNLDLTEAFELSRQIVPATFENAATMRLYQAASAVYSCQESGELAQLNDALTQFKEAYGL